MAVVGRCRRFESGRWDVKTDYRIIAIYVAVFVILLVWALTLAMFANSQ